MVIFEEKSKHRFRKRLREKKRIWTAGLSFLMAVVLLISIMPMKTKALSINGEGNGISNGSLVTGSYTITSAARALGYRFTLVNSSGNTVGAPHDIYSSSFIQKYKSVLSSSTEVSRFKIKFSKMELGAIYESLSFDLDTLNGTSDSNFYNNDTILDSSWNLSLANEAANMPDWASNANMKIILANAWGYSIDDLAKYGLAVAIEPIYYVKVDGHRLALTVTELAIVSVADGSGYSATSNLWDATIKSGGSEYTWACISDYTHASWPMSLYLSEDMFGLAGGSNLQTLKASYKRGTSRQIIESGYGIMVVYTDYLSNYTVSYNGNGATSGSTASSLHIMDTPSNLTANGFAKTGYSFTGWNTKPDGSGTSYSDQQSVTNLTSISGATVTLYAQWEPITYTIEYNGNGSTGGETAASTHTYDVAQNLTPNGYTKPGATFIGWNTKADGSGTLYTDEQSVKNLTDVQGKVITLYAMWVFDNDEGPVITAVDRWFTLKEAQTGRITLEELMETASAEDSLIGNYTDFSAGEGTFTIMDYSEDEFTAFESSGFVTVTYYAKDLNGNEAYKTVKVYITDVGLPASLTQSNDKVLGFDTRFISHEFYLDDSGTFVGESNGGFNANSKWLIDSTYVHSLANVLSNSKGDRGWSKPPVYSFTLDGGEISEMKNFIETFGPGSSLSAFFDGFLR